MTINPELISSRSRIVCQSNVFSCEYNAVFFSRSEYKLLNERISRDLFYELKRILYTYFARILRFLDTKTVTKISNPMVVSILTLPQLIHLLNDVKAPCGVPIKIINIQSTISQNPVFLDPT